MSSLEAFLPDDIEQHVQLNRARLNSYGILRAEIKTYCECRGDAARNAKQKGSSHPGGDDPKARTLLEGLNTNKGGSKRKHKSKNAMDAHNLYSTKPANVEPEVEIGGFDMSFPDVDALQQQGSEWIKIGVDTQSVTYGKKLPGHVDFTFRTATGLSKYCERLYVEGCDDWRVNLRVRGVQALVCKPLLSVGEYTAMGGVTVFYGDKGYMFHKGSNVAKKIDAWIQKEMRDSK